MYIFSAKISQNYFVMIISFWFSSCQPGWTNPNCDKCIVRSGCSHGTCVHPHDCLCGPGTENPNGAGVLCEEPVCEYV